MSKRILVVSDRSFTRTVIANACIQSGSEVVCETVSQLAVMGSYSRFKPNMVFIDLCMLERSGLQLLQAIHAVDPHANVVICASWGQKQLLIEAAILGAKELLFQPLSQEQVQRTILCHV